MRHLGIISPAHAFNQFPEDCNYSELGGQLRVGLLPNWEARFSQKMCRKGRFRFDVCLDIVYSLLPAWTTRIFIFADMHKARPKSMPPTAADAGVGRASRPASGPGMHAGIRERSGRDAGAQGSMRRRALGECPAPADRLPKTKGWCSRGGTSPIDASSQLAGVSPYWGLTEPQAGSGCRRTSGRRAARAGRARGWGMQDQGCAQALRSGLLAPRV